MTTLWLFYHETYQQLSINPTSFKRATIGAKQRDTVTVPHFPFADGPITITKKNDQNGLTVVQQQRVIGELEDYKPLCVTDQQQEINMIATPAPVNKGTYYIGGRSELTLTTSEHGHIQQSEYLINEGKDVRILRVNNAWHLIPNESIIYVNGKQLNEPLSLQVGDIIFWSAMTLRLIEEDLIEIVAWREFHTELSMAEKPVSEMQKKYPFYRRTPRMIYELPTEKVQLSFPAQDSDDNGRSLWLTILPPLVMLLVMGTIAIIQPRGLFMIISVMMFTTTMFVSTVQYFKDKKQRKIRTERRNRIYTKYLETKREELYNISESQRTILHYHFPTFERMKYLTDMISDRIWERTIEHKDFLEMRLGIGNVPATYTIAMNNSDMSNREMDELLEQSQQMEKVYREVTNAPVTAHLAHGSIGLIGKPGTVKNELHQLIGQLAFAHSYHDVRFVLIFDEAEYEQWEWMKWLPHFQLPNSFAKGFIYNEQSRDQLLSSLYEMIRERDLQEEKKERIFLPHVVFIVANHSLISEHVILEYLEGEYSHLGISTIFAAEKKESLTDNIHTLIRYVNEKEGDILIQKKKAVSIPFTLDHHQRHNNESFARMLRTLEHQVGMTNSIPTSVSFLEMFKAKEVDELPIVHNWQTRESAKSLAVPVGLKGKEDIVELNLHEKAHGPHGLLAGTTGSGKSEFLQTYILSLAVHFHPHEVGFLLIDYKGGGMAQPFKNIPHLLGTITNIEGSKNFSTRALASIKSELKRRQRLFDQYEVNHIHDYTDLYKQGMAAEPLPHLFLISDEFAELKSEEPEFIRELVSAARIGRSLGVHLILATQKPGGVIDDQIWSNARFKVALKVQDATDSKEILKNADAASITITGRGYLQVGNNEVYELFQSAWSGAPYLEETSDSEDEVAIVTDLGLIPLSDVSTLQEKKRNVLSEIDVIAERIATVQKELGIQKLRSPWLPPLAERISRFEYEGEREGEFLIGLVDEPEQQRQVAYRYTMMDDGNVGIFGSSGYGKSFTAMTLLMSFAESYSPEELHYYIFDFGNGTLLPLRQLPHTADYFLMDQTRKIEKFISMMKEEMMRRKQLFQQYEVSNIKMYNALSDTKLPLYFITIDNFDLVKDEMPDLEMQFTQFVRDGQSLGIYMIFTATRINSVRQAVLNNLKTKVVHYLMDNSEAYSILGRVPYKVEAIPGRAIIKTDQAFFSQLFLPANGQDEFEILEEMKRDIQRLKIKYDGMELPEPIPMLSDKLLLHEFITNRRIVRERGVIPLGLDEESVRPVHMNLTKSKHCLVMGQGQKGKTNVLQLILHTSLSQQVSNIGLFDAVDRGLSSYASEQSIHYMDTKDQIVQWLDQAEAILMEREGVYLEAVQQGAVSSLTFEPLLLVIDGFARFQKTIDALIQERITKLMKNYTHLGFTIIAAGSPTDFSKGFDSLTTELKQVNKAIMLMKKSEQSLFTLAYDRKEADIHPGFGYFVENGKATRIQIPLCTNERKILA
ncbi:type VII secretion protein EssC [Metabacillus iocasae]|uniref:S-DNA-T family DNA segregation ATPase FtsK/SpoIIIE n=1 Tax=Priestia iocasae TaxID=2291674 RepID=A0ABS2QWD2_9BACI|nr:type VII secretion protein EssC [Metabacillus iocasae]MBM7703051.1 S-DNA-T family DNA segregation ATPase FtsK/SpoIIIE [Metabacillus iocasae]